ncbi:MAG: hypothetical protein V5A18_10610 [Haloarculaceae archaeon]
MPTVYAALDRRLVVARGEAGDWHANERLPATDLECVAAAPARPDRAFVGTTAAGLHRTTDGGASWTVVGGFAAREEAVSSLLVSPHDPRTVYAGTEPSRVYRSTDGGETWREREGLGLLPSSERWSYPPDPDTSHVRWIAEAPDEAGRLYVAIEAGAFLRSPDGGETWLDHPEGARRDVHSVATHPDAPDRIYVAAGDGYAESGDRGHTWQYPQPGLDHRYCWSVAVDPGDPACVLVSAAAGPGKAHAPERAETYVYRRRGRGDGGTWEVAMAGLEPAEGLARPVLATDDTPGRFYAATNRGLFHSQNAGDTWDRIPAGPAAVYNGEVPRGLVVV